MANYSILADKNKESWLVVESDNVIRIFTNKNSAVQYRSQNKDKVVNVLHRYSDGTLHPLLNWPGEANKDSTVQNEIITAKELEEFYEEIDNIDDYDLYDIGSIDLTPANADNRPEEE